MSDKVTAYPLCWPFGWPRTEVRESGKFNTELSGALRNVNRQIELMGGKGIILSSNYTLGVDNPKDPGVVAYFAWDGVHLAIPCDRWSRLAASLQAIALTIEAMRGLERWGAKHMIKAMFTGFKQLPSSNRKPWWEVLGCLETDRPEPVRNCYRQQAKLHHPDTGGVANATLFAEISDAWERSGHK